MIWNERMKQLREDNDISQTEMAKYLKISQRTVSYYEKNERQVPIDILLLYMKKFDVSANYMLGITDKK